MVKDGYTSFEQHEHAPQLSAARYDWFRKLLKEDPQSPYGNALLLPDSILKQFPRVAFQVCGVDMLRDGALLLEKKLKELGIETRIHVYKGLPHCFWNHTKLRSAPEYRQRLVDYAQWLFRG